MIRPSFDFGHLCVERWQASNVFPSPLRLNIRQCQLLLNYQTQAFERERERERETDRQTDRQTERDRERDRERESEISYKLAKSKHIYHSHEEIWIET